MNQSVVVFIGLIFEHVGCSGGVRDSVEELSLEIFPFGSRFFTILIFLNFLKLFASQARQLTH